jgi:hypothetical protein
VKAITQSKIKIDTYNPKGYLNPFENKDPIKDVSLNSLHATQVFNRRLAAQQTRANISTTPGRVL